METLSKGEQERLARLRASRMRRVRLVVVWLIIVAVVAAGGYWLVIAARKAETQKPGVAIPDQGQEHIALGQDGPTYNSNPPTSGPHYPETTTWGVHDVQPPDEFLIHNLEHGGIWISYRDPQNQELIGKLKEIVAQYAIKVVLTPRPENDSAIAVAAWGRLLKLEEFDRQQILDFIKAFINKGPEQVPF